MVSHLVGNDVGVGKIAVGAYVAFHIGEKREVDIHRLVGRAVERTHRRCSAAAAALHAACEEHQFGRDVFLANLFKFGSPYVFGASQHLACKLSQFVLLSRRFVCRGRVSAKVEVAAANDVEHIAKVAAHQQHHNSHHGNAADAQFAKRKHATAATASVVDVAAFASSCHSHSCQFCYKVDLL